MKERKLVGAKRGYSLFDAGRNTVTRDEEPRENRENTCDGSCATALGESLKQKWG
jgi:hypothetical protein